MCSNQYIKENQMITWRTKNRVQHFILIKYKSQMFQ